MDDYRAAIGRDVGKVDTDSGGLARYSLKLQAPPGIRNGTEPELSLEYCQGAGNGSLGAGWALGGLSCIRRGPSSLAYDQSNPTPSDYDRTKSKLNLDGAELLCISSDYESQDAQFTTETESVRRTVTRHGSGFLLVESTGRRSEYGTTDDSRVLVSSTQNVREWRLKTTSDYHGNTITYHYVSSPQSGGKVSDANTCYLSSIRYTSNHKTGYQGVRIIKLEYGPRNDVVVQTVQGDKCVWASLLTSVRFGTIFGEEVSLTRSYNLAYASSPHTGDSKIVSITETALEGGETVQLLPSTFGYTSPGVTQEKMFSSLSQKVANLPSPNNTVALFTMNISGRSLADIACIRYNQSTEQMTLKTYLAEKDSTGKTVWNQSTGPGSEAMLPLMNHKNGFPNILCPDMNGDGRADLIVPYANSNNKVCFSISQCVGTGFQKSRPKETTFVWNEGSKFMAVDLSGRGTVDIVQIFPSGSKLAFRNFPGVTKDGIISLKDAVTTTTNSDYSGTLEWCQLSHAGTGAKSLVRIWAQDIGKEQRQLKATCYTSLKAGDSSGGFRESTSSLLGEPVPASKNKYHVLACDINADGTQDIVLATVDFRNGKTYLVFTTYLGDGHGGFEKHGESLTREVTAPSPLTDTEPGSFHTTNLNGSNYPSLCYVYQTRSAKSFACISVDGRSDGFVGDATVSIMVQDLPSDKMQVIASDINGNGMGDWIFYNLDNGVPRVLPVYNTAKVTDFLEWSQTSMGLRTSLAYGSLTDQGVYTSAVDWKNFANQATDSYPVIAAPNYVVTNLEHTNDGEVNSLEYKVSIRKSYANARINTLGRGWQGFEKINTLNVTDGIMTTERYHQIWPLTGTKSQVDTCTLGGKVVKSIASDYQSAFRQSGPWKIFKINKILERIRMYDDQTEARCNTVEYDYDESGNMILQHSWETQLGETMHESWNRCAYTAIDGVTDVMTAEKLSTTGSNLDMSKFEPGDSSLTLYENETDRAVLRSVAKWSTDINDFTRKHITFNEYGKEIRTLDSAGLARETTYDEVFKSFPVKVAEQGAGVSSVELGAFDGSSGLEIARLEPNGLLTCYSLDGFGRTTEVRAKAAGPGPHTVQASLFHAQRSLIADEGLKTLLGQSHLEPQQKISYERQTSPSGAAFMALSTTQLFHEGTGGESEVTDYVDCVKQVRKRSSRDGDELERTWLCWEFHSLGQQTFASFPTKVPGEVGLDLIPDAKQGVRSALDILGRPIREMRPTHGDHKHMIVKEMTYSLGGARVRETTLTPTSGSTQAAAQIPLAVLERRYIRIGDEDHVIENLDESGSLSTLRYDIEGRLLQTLDAAGNSETRSYTSQGQLLRWNNVYQSTSPNGQVPALSYEYDTASHLVRQVNAAGESITYNRDAKGRPLLKTGSDGKTLKYEYDRGGLEQLSSVTTLPQGETGPWESRHEFTYDHRGRLANRKLALADGQSYTTSFSYNWQDEVVRKVLPDGATLAHQYHGSEVSQSTLSSGPASNWSLQAHVEKLNAFGRPELLAVSGTGLAQPAVHEWTYDSQGFPISHSLTSDSKTMVKEDYVYNNLDQIARKHEFVTGVTTDFVYQGRRLVSSQPGSGSANLYAYDKAGNLTEKQGIKISGSSDHIVGSKEGRTVYDVKYDAAGRMIRRETAESAFDFRYDGFGAVKSMVDTSRQLSIDLLVDFEGEMLSRKQADGTTDLFLDEDFSIHIHADGTKTARHHLMNYSNAHGTGHLLGTVSNVFEAAGSKRPLSGSRSISLQFSDTKGNVTHSFGEDMSLREKLDYDDFGLLLRSGAEDSDQQMPCTYEAKFFDNDTGLLNFGARWYDPLVGRFVTPDDILDIGSLLRTDGLNRYAFENNDPINNTDPTGHWSWSAIGGAVLSGVLIVGAVALTVATGGAAAPLAAMAVGALAGGGIAGMTYSFGHKDETDPGKFWGGFATTVAVNALIGAATGAAGAFSSPGYIASGAGRIAAKAVAGGAISVASQTAERAVENVFYGANKDLWEGAGTAFLQGAVIGGAMGYYGEKSAAKAANKAAAAASSKTPFKLSVSSKDVVNFKPTNQFADLTKEAWKMGGKELLKHGGKVAAKDAVIDKKAIWAKIKS